MNTSQGKSSAVPLRRQVLAKRCLYGRELALTSELRSLLHARRAEATPTPERGTAQGTYPAKTVAEAIIRIQAIRASWDAGRYDGCERRTEPVILGRRGSVSRCQVLKLHLVDTLEQT